MLPSYSHIRFMQKNNNLYRNELKKICKKIDLDFIDLFNFWDTFYKDDWVVSTLSLFSQSTFH